jgi:hypothetical protein
MEATMAGAVSLATGGLRTLEILCEGKERIQEIV